jgi:hypothetical protein
LLAVYVANVAIQKYMAAFKDEQELLLALADMLIAAYAVDSTLARVLQRDAAGDAGEVHHAIARTFTAETYSRVVEIAHRIAPTLADGSDLSALRARLDRFTHRPTTDVIALKRVVADHVVETPAWSL